jgi:glycerol kinase
LVFSTLNIVFFPFTHKFWKMRNPFELDFESVDGDSEPQDFEAPDTHLQQEEALQQHRRSMDYRPKQRDDGDRSILQDEEQADGDLKNRFIGTIDQGTTSTRFIIFDCTGVPVAKYQTEFRQIHEHPG